MREYGIKISELSYSDSDGNEVDRLYNGYRFIAHTKFGYNKLLDFFKEGGLDVYENRHIFMAINPTEQYLIQTGKRLFKGFDEYDDLHRFTFDIETTGLDPTTSVMFQIGMKDNKGFEHVLTMENDDQEKMAIETFFNIINELQPAIICGYNSENFDWSFILKRAEILGLDVKYVSKTLKRGMPLYRKKSTLKMGAEMEYYDQTIMWGYSILDVWHSVRRAGAINSSIKETGLKYITKFSKLNKPNRVYIEHENISKLWNSDDTYIFYNSNGKYFKKDDHTIDGECEEMTGKEIVTRYLIDDLWETEQVDNMYNQATFLLSRILPSTLHRVSTMGTAASWKIMMLAWSYENNLAIPEHGEKRDFTGGLSRLLKIGFSKNIVKLDYNSLYPSIQITHDVFPSADVTGALKGMLTYIYDSRIMYKDLMNKADKEGNSKLAAFYDRKQLPLKILNNSNFGSVSAPEVYPWGDIDVGEMITCTGRQYLRLMVKFFMKKGMEPVLLDTDGVNFTIPDDIEKYKYTGKGSHRVVIKGKKYVGIEALVSEFNEKYMKGVMGLDIDKFYDATINLGRKNYANLSNGKVILTGNSIKSKKIPRYIEKFIDVGLTMLLNGDGKGFVNEYYDTIERIYNKEISLIDIASKAKVKISLKEYKKKMLMTNKSGGAAAKQAHMELLLKEGITPSLGDVIYYINTGSKKSNGDVQRKMNKETGKSETILNCVLLPKEDVESNKKDFGDYNVLKYIDMFNKKILPLMGCFSPDIRDSIIITSPKDRQYFTEEQLKLCSGFPLEEKHQDELEKDVMEMEESEIIFWDKVGVDPFYMINL